MHAHAISEGDNVLLVDDLIATGSTVSAAVELIRGVGGNVVEACFVIDLPDLGGVNRLRALGCDCFALCEFEGA
jgi:adenine phosphoribosyltransferase